MYVQEPVVQRQHQPDRFSSCNDGHSTSHNSAMPKTTVNPIFACLELLVALVTTVVYLWWLTIICCWCIEPVSSDRPNPEHVRLNQTFGRNLLHLPNIVRSAEQQFGQKIVRFCSAEIGFGRSLPVSEVAHAFAMSWFQPQVLWQNSILAGE